MKRSAIEEHSRNPGCDPPVFQSKQALISIRWSSHRSLARYPMRPPQSIAGMRNTRVDCRGRTFDRWIDVAYWQMTLINFQQTDVT